jgi:hypothetical protein
MNSLRLRFYPIVAVAALLLCASSVFAQTELNTNLLVNGDAESQTVPADENIVSAPTGWTSTPFSFTVVRYDADGPEGKLNTVDSSNIGGGDNYFAGGPDNDHSSSAQFIGFSSDRFDDIDHGKLTAVLSAFLGGYLGHGDRMIIRAQFLDENNNLLSQFHIGPVTPLERQNLSQLEQRTNRLVVPAGARSVVVTMDAVRTDGTYNRAYADNVVFKLIQTPASIPSFFSNLSTRLKVGTGDDVAIGGFIARGTGNFESVILRCLGPSLGKAHPPVPGALPDPTLELRDANGTLRSNNDWQTGGDAASISAAGLAPSDPRESALSMGIDSGQYTFIARGFGGATGVALVELYSFGDQIQGRNLNISTRGRSEPGDDVIIAGFIVNGQNAKKVVVRALGPSLQDAGVPGPITDPVVELHDKAGRLVEQNDNWRDGQEAAAIEAAGLAPQRDSEAAIYMTLEPGTYTAILRSASNAESGNALVEVYDLD